MADYRAYIRGGDGHFFDAVELVCESDNEAIEKAKQLVDGHDVELWQLDRKVAEFKHNQGNNFPTRALTQGGQDCVVRNCSYVGKVCPTRQEDRALPEIAFGNRRPAHNGSDQFINRGITDAKRNTSSGAKAVRPPHERPLSVKNADAHSNISLFKNRNERPKAVCPGPKRGPQAYEYVPCPACGLSHLVNKKTAKVVVEPDEGGRVVGGLRFIDDTSLDFWCFTGPVKNRCFLDIAGTSPGRRIFAGVP